MSSSEHHNGKAGVRRRGLLALALLAPAVLATAACGFQPMYGTLGTNSIGAAELQQVDIGVIPDRYGQKLRNLLIDRFYADGRPAAPHYRLDTTLTASEQKLSIQKDATATRAQLVVNAPYRLIDAATGKILFQANARSYISYNVLEQQYGALAAVENAYDRALLEIANEMTIRVAAELGRKS
ncbi:LPS-assembly lipoprotein [Azospirillum sp. OGB3]|uniref:LPS assembly lipoprotein LptE n=1 Tax=Azospirillum sp. OGB3 TaxID=2587012 RepID=UPI00160608A9|nr:LPS assembly lipoprotein LptE [Azospirillum sp. OGB3]MBB3263029.1 LPS-assembly lipoprotein [Azospirillum sp. OGB3]